MPYWSCLKLFGDWYVQLWAESLGKKSQGPTPVAALGSTDQHSLLQLFKEGPRNKIVGFMDVVEKKTTQVGTPLFPTGKLDYLCNQNFEKLSRQASVATEKSLNNSDIPTYRIELQALEEFTLGSLFFFFETACAFAGELYGVNAFDQPGVEETKKLLRALL
jgi:glucose-6-phosphate isomerase